MKLGDLPIGARFKFYARGAIRTKTSPTTFEAGGSDVTASLEAEVLPVDLDAAGSQPVRTSRDLARDMLKRMGVPQYWKLTDEQLAELVALIEKKSKRPDAGNGRSDFDPRHV